MSYSIVKVFHADHGVSEETMLWALGEIAPADGFFMRTLTLPADHAPLVSKLYGPAAGDPAVTDAVVRVRDASDAYRPETPFVTRPARPTHLVTIIGTVTEGKATIFTAYGGPAASRVPNDPSLVPGSPEHEQAVKFWAEHALAADV